jgi:serine/threonine protein kinase
LDGNSDVCPVCALKSALESENYATATELRFEHYQILKNEDKSLMELGHGSMGVTYKALDVQLQRLVALKIINAKFIGDASARQRFVREARAAASVRHQNVATVHHLGQIGGDYFYAMEFVEGETLAKCIHHAGRLSADLALEIIAEVAAGLQAIYEQHLVHRDIKPSNIMVSLREGRVKSVKIIDLGLAKGVAEEGCISTPGSFVGTPEYASPEQFAGVAVDIRSDIYSLGITLWEMLSGSLPFQGSSPELVYHHQHASLPVERLARVRPQVLPLLEILLEKDPARRFQTPNDLLKALATVSEALDSDRRLAKEELRSSVGTKFLSSQSGILLSSRAGKRMRKNGVAVLPFESLSPDKDDSYFADGVQDEILNNLAKIAKLRVISRTSVMQYRAGTQRDLRQIASALGVANILEGTVRRERNRVRVSTQLIDARKDQTIWADSYDRDLNGIFAIQSDVAQTIAAKLAVALSPAEKRTIEKKPTENLDAYDLYLQAKELFFSGGNVAKYERLLEAVGFLERAVRLDPKFALAYCASAKGNDQLYFDVDQTPERLALADAAVSAALRLQPDLPEAHLAKARHLFQGYRNYDDARTELAIAKRSLPNSAELLNLEAAIDVRQGNVEKAIQGYREALTRDPRNGDSLGSLAAALCDVRQFDAAAPLYDRLIELRPDLPMLKVDKAVATRFIRTGDTAAVWSAFASLPQTALLDPDALDMRVWFSLGDHDWTQAEQLIEKMKSGNVNTNIFFGSRLAPAECCSVLLARLRKEPITNPAFTETRAQLNAKVLKASQDASLLSILAVLDALLNKKEIAISEAKRAAEMLPVSKDAFEGSKILRNLAIVYAWTDELDLAFDTLGPLINVPFGIGYGELRYPLWEPLRQDPRFDKLLAELAPKD